MTSVEWLDEQIQERVIAQDVVARKMIIEISMEDYIKLKKEAKEMEKQQHGKTWDIALDKYEVRAGNYMRAYEDFDNYFAETYGSKGSDATSSQTDENGKPLTYWGGLKDRTCDHTNCREVCPECQIAPIKKVIRIDDINEEADELIRQNELTSSQTEISDEEIEEASENAWSDYEYEEGNLYSTTFKGGWKLAIKWYREQLKKKQ